jgi:hypothetical protein
MLGDNMEAIALTKNPYLNDQSIHININHDLVPDFGRNGRHQVSYVPVADMVLDWMTQPLQRIAFVRFKNEHGIGSR